MYFLDDVPIDIQQAERVGLTKLQSGFRWSLHNNIVLATEAENKDKVDKFVNMFKIQAPEPLRSLIVIIQCYSRGVYSVQFSSVQFSSIQD